MNTDTATATATATMAAPTGSATSTATNTTATTTSGAATAGSETDPSSTGDANEDLDMEAEDFVCLALWDQVRRFRITNLRGHLDEALAVANSATGGVYPVGTVIQLIPNEAMVKRSDSFAPATNNWEYFSLSTSAAGTEILDRGAAGVLNQFNGDCLNCHSESEPQWDYVCEDGQGCAPLPLTPSVIQAIQDADPRCK